MFTATGYEPTIHVGDTQIFANKGYDDSNDNSPSNYPRASGGSRREAPKKPPHQGTTAAQTPYLAESTEYLFYGLGGRKEEKDPAAHLIPSETAAALTQALIEMMKSDNPAIRKAAKTMAESTAATLAGMVGFPLGPGP